MSGSDAGHVAPRRGNGSVIKQGMALLLVAMVPALLAAWVHPRKPSWTRAEEVTLATVGAWPDVLWIDARSAEAFAEDHVPEAVNLAPARWESQIEPVLQGWRPGMRVVVYCDGHTCQASHEVARRLRGEFGLENVHVLAGGWEAWRQREKEPGR